MIDRSADYNQRFIANRQFPTHWSMVVLKTIVTPASRSSTVAIRRAGFARWDRSIDRPTDRPCEQTTVGGKQVLDEFMLADRT